MHNSRCSYNNTTMNLLHQLVEGSLGLCHWKAVVKILILVVKGFTLLVVVITVELMMGLIVELMILEMLL